MEMAARIPQSRASTGFFAVAATAGAAHVLALRARPPVGARVSWTPDGATSAEHPATRRRLGVLTYWRDPSHAPGAGRAPQ